MDTERLCRLVSFHSRGLEEALEAIHRGDRDGALHLYGDILRRRLAAMEDGLPAPTPEVLWEAEDLLSNRIFLLDLPPEDVGMPMDWLRSPGGDCQWQSHMGYLYWAANLLTAYKATGERRYVEKWKEIHLDFLKSHPYGTEKLTYSRRVPVWENEYLPVYGGEGFCPDYIGGSWISLACGSRIGTWLKSMAFLARESLLDDDLLWPLAESLMTDHLHVIMNAPRRGTPNQYISCAGALLRLSTVFWEFFEAPGAYFVGMDRMEAAFRLCVFPDGTDAEQSMNYNFGLARGFAEIVRECGLEKNRRIRALQALAEKRCAYLAGVTGPGGHYPDLAKTHAVTDMRPALRELTNRYPQAAEARQILDCLEGKRADAPLCVDYPYGGYTVHRSGWGEEDAFLFFKYSRYSPGHKHEDTGSLTLTGFGRQLLVDTGNFNYSDDPASRRMHAFFFASVGHNAADIDGLSQRRLVRERSFKVDERWPERADNETEYDKVRSILALQEAPCPGVRYLSDAFAVSQSLYEDGWQKRVSESGTEGEVISGTHLRTLVYLRPAAWLVADTFRFADGGDHAVTLHWHPGSDFRPEAVTVTPGITVTHAPGGNVGVWSFGEQPPEAEWYYGSEEPFRGWYTVDYAVKVPCMDVTQCFPACGEGTVLSLIVPFRDGNAPMVTGDGLSLQAELGGRTLAVEMKNGTLHIEYDGKVLEIDGAGAKESCPDGRI